MDEESTPPKDGPHPRDEGRATRQAFVGFGVSLAVGSSPYLCEFLNNPFLVGPVAAKQFANAFGWTIAGNLLGLPFIAGGLLLACPKRNFALGFLLGTGLCWLLSFATCAQRLKI